MEDFRRDPVTKGESRRLVNARRGIYQCRAA
jgi:hypothetical protein